MDSQLSEQQTTKTQQSTGKIIATVFSNALGIDNLIKRKIIYGKYYMALLVFHRKKSRKNQMKNHRDNELCLPQRFQKLPQPLYTPDLALRY